MKSQTNSYLLAEQHFTVLVVCDEDGLGIGNVRLPGAEGPEKLMDFAIGERGIGVDPTCSRLKPAVPVGRGVRSFARRQKRAGAKVEAVGWYDQALSLLDEDDLRARTLSVDASLTAQRQSGPPRRLAQKKFFGGV